ncbi:uncharacterized protein [Centruroides vittatus]|uniref:uncharacterized protein n=1 Tax=Centruroides vittatus TaxID=120091 RepID=UPI003510BF54
MKILERVLDRKVESRGDHCRRAVWIHARTVNSRCHFCPSANVGKYWEKQTQLHMAFIDLEKAYDTVPRQELWRCLRKKLVPEKYVRLIQELYRDVATKRVREEAPWTMLYADDIVLCAETKEELRVKLERWLGTLEGRA